MERGRRGEEGMGVERRSVEGSRSGEENEETEEEYRLVGAVMRGGE